MVVVFGLCLGGGFGASIVRAFRVVRVPTAMVGMCNYSSNLLIEVADGTVVVQTDLGGVAGVASGGGDFFCYRCWCCEVG